MARCVQAGTHAAVVEEKPKIPDCGKRSLPKTPKRGRRLEHVGFCRSRFAAGSDDNASLRYLAYVGSGKGN